MSGDRSTADVGERLVAHASHLVDDELIRSTASAVLAQPTPSGAEGPSAAELVSWGTRHAPDLSWAQQDVGAGRANLLAWTGGLPWLGTRGVWMYAHLDHSLSGVPELDQELTGWGRWPSPSTIDATVVRGLGVAVARGPAICALAAARALAIAARSAGNQLLLGVLLAAGGTHRRVAPSPAQLEPADPIGLATGFGLGVTAALDAGWRPDAVLNVKGGAPGVLSAEPGCAMIQLAWRGTFTALPARGDLPGAAVVAAHIALCVEAWRADYRAGADGGQVAGDLCVGAVHSGLSYKTDLQPGYAAVGVYLSTVNGQRATDIADRLGRRVRDHLAAAGIPAGAGTLTITPYAQHEAASTPENAPIVAAARTVWERAAGPGSSLVHGYRGATDGNLFRLAGVPTVRFGPTARACPDDPTVEELDVAEMIRFSRMYVDTVVLASLATVESLTGVHR